MSTIINGTTDAITFPDATIQNTSAIVGGKVPYTNLPAGSVLQVVQGVSTTLVSTTTSTNITSGVSASITPKFSTSKILIMFSSVGYGNAAGSQLTTYIYKNGSQLGSNYFGQQYGPSSGVEANVSFNYLDSPATTSATTYAVYFNNTTGVGTVYLQNGSYGTITLMEIAG